MGTQNKYVLLTCSVKQANGWLYWYMATLTAFVRPNVQLLSQFRNHQECPPSLTLLGLKNISKNVIPNVHNILSFCSKQVTHNVRRAWVEMKTHLSWMTDFHIYVSHTQYSWFYAQYCDFMLLFFQPWCPSNSNMIF